MPAASVPIDIDQGEDWAADIYYTDEVDVPMPVVHPCRLTIKANSGETILTLNSVETQAPDTLYGITLIPEFGVIRFYIPAEDTALIGAGHYRYDLFVTVDADEDFPPPQIARLIYGTVTVNKRITHLED